MLLRPRRTLYKSSHKKRSLKFNIKKKIIKQESNKLIYGQFGLKNINTDFYLYNKYLFKIKIFLKKSVRRSNITNRKLWINIFPHIPVTKKVIGSRMGKGKGKPSNWSAKIPAEIIFIELRNTRPGRSNYFLNQIKYKLPGKFIIIKKYYNYDTLISFKNRTMQYNYVYN